MNSVDFSKYSLEELKNLKNNLEKKPKPNFAPKLNIIDKFTNIDELLIETIRALKDLTQDQRETNRQLQISNKLLLGLLIEEAADGTISLRGESGIDTAAILEEIGGGGAVITRKIDLANTTVEGNKIIFQAEFEGGLAEVLFTSSTSTTDNKDYSVRVLGDDEIAYQGTFAEFEARGGTETDMACFEDEINNWYLLQFQNVNFANKILIEVYDSSATFLRIYVKYHKST
ncbi:hypothetical protein LCGC14_0223680 [marine sediment metagenome]|uniref:Uncharacterized protein n=1 Tax=marine sediment metagenome TaxID=412755 RepID=A0A0F9UC98_9ZZZZ